MPATKNRSRVRGLQQAFLGGFLSLDYHNFFHHVLSLSFKRTLAV
jgi:hypothetical protein